MQIETKRLYLRELTLDDFSELYDVLADPAIMQYYPYTFDKDRVMNCITKNIASSATAIANGMCKVDEFFDDENEKTVVYAITRNDWILLKK